MEDLQPEGGMIAEASGHSRITRTIGRDAAHLPTDMDMAFVIEARSVY